MRFSAATRSSARCGTSCNAARSVCSVHERRQSGSGSSGSGSSRRSVHDERRQSGRSRSGSSADSCARPHVSRPIAPPASAQSAIAQSAIAQTAKSASGSATRRRRSRAVRMAAQPRTGRSSWTPTKARTHSSSRRHPQRRRQGSVSASVRCSAFASPSTRRSSSSSCARTHGPAHFWSPAHRSRPPVRGLLRPRRRVPPAPPCLSGRPSAALAVARGSHRRRPRWGPDGHGAAFRSEIEGRSRARWAGKTCRQSVHADQRSACVGVS